MHVKRKKVGIALGGGGARGFAHIGVLKVLQKEGIPIDYMVGVSMGALVAAYFSLGLNLEKIEAECKTFTKTKAMRLFVDLGNPRKSILKGIKIKNYITSLVKKAEFHDLEIPLQIVTTNLANGEQVIQKHGDVATAIQASICVPGVFPPVKIDNKHLFDGGIVNPIPIDIVEKMGADIVIGVDLMNYSKVRLEKPGFIAALMQSYEIIRMQAKHHNLNRANGNAVIISPKAYGTIESFKFFEIENFIKLGERAARKMLPEIKKRLNS